MDKRGALACASSAPCWASCWASETMRLGLAVATVTHVLWLGLPVSGGEIRELGSSVTETPTAAPTSDGCTSKGVVASAQKISNLYGNLPYTLDNYDYLGVASASLSDLNQRRRRERPTRGSERRRRWWVQGWSSIRPLSHLGWPREVRPEDQ